ncbi:hypothetical protein FHG87_010425 [Trinorchestia longiramus]|nr:hypothetical protein FHG87_010425 [Trinorchestia longiramus]
MSRVWLTPIIQRSSWIFLTSDEQAKPDHGGYGHQTRVFPYNDRSTLILSFYYCTKCVYITAVQPYSITMSSPGVQKQVHVVVDRSMWWWCTGPCGGGVQVHVVVYRSMWWCTGPCGGGVQVHVVVVYRFMWWCAGSCGGVQVHVVVYRFMWWCTGPCGGVQVHVVVYRSMRWYSTCFIFQLMSAGVVTW